MEELKSQGSQICPTLPHLWQKFVDDTFIIQQENHSQQLLQHINSQDLHIQFITEDPNQEGALPFLDTQVSPGPNNTLVPTRYRKPTHTNQYLHWDSNHFITVKNSVFSTLGFRVRVVCWNQQTLQQENEHIMKPYLLVIPPSPQQDTDSQQWPT